MTLNVDGARQLRGRKAVGKCILGLVPQADICIITETHLLEREVDWLRLETVEEANRSCQELT